MSVTCDDCKREIEIDIEQYYTLNKAEGDLESGDELQAVIKVICEDCISTTILQQEE